VIVALVILSIGFITVLELFSGGVRSVEISDRYLKGVNLAHHKFGELELTDFKSSTLSGQFANDEDFRWELAIGPYPSVLNDEEANLKVMQVVLNVFWEDSGKKRNVQIASLKTVGNTFPAPDAVILDLTKNVSGNVVVDFGDADNIFDLEPVAQNQSPFAFSDPETVIAGPRFDICGMPIQENPTPGLIGAGTP
jgi:general secretion pathway protein I